MFDFSSSVAATITFDCKFYDTILNDNFTRHPSGVRSYVFFLNIKHFRIEYCIARAYLRKSKTCMLTGIAAHFFMSIISKLLLTNYTG